MTVNMSCHVMSCHVMSCHVMSCHIMLCHVMAGGVPQPGDHEDVAGELQPRHHTQVSRIAIISNVFFRVGLNIFFCPIGWVSQKLSRKSSSGPRRRMKLCKFECLIKMFQVLL